jgi:hypothetical protein
MLAYVMVHEIGHLFLGPNMHSSRGIMRPRWQADDLREMEIDRQVFPSEQARSLQIKFEGRARSQKP